MAKANSTGATVTVTAETYERVMRIRTLAESIKLFLDADEQGAGGSENAHAFQLAGMIYNEADRIVNGGEA